MTILLIKHDEPTEVYAYCTLSEIFDTIHVADVTLIDTSTNEVFVYDEEGLRELHNKELIIHSPDD